MALPNEAATHRLMVDIAAILEPGDLVTLSGDLGAASSSQVQGIVIMK